MRVQKKYFCYGILVSSVLWIIIIYLFLRAQEQDRPRFAGDYSQGDGHKIQPRHGFVIRDNRRQSMLDDVKDESLVSNKLAELGIIHTAEDQKTRDKGYRDYAFNQLISDRLGNFREIPDTRHRLCRDKTYPELLPKASVVICFYNEAWSALMRTLHTVVRRSPVALLEEIVLVDDASDLPHLSQQLEFTLQQDLPQVKLIRTKTREGLIRARMLGAEHARGEVVVFLDSHCEVNTDWLQPLLTHIKASKHNVAVPIIDIINHDTLVYEASPLVRGGFNWGLHFRWDQIPDKYLKAKTDYANPIMTPTMAGGLFAIDRQYFYEIGKYDSGMDIWGGENLEISFRIWQCGGHLDIIPCSRVGHIFRKRRPYGAPDGADTMTKNSLRMAHVWMDDYKEYYFQQRPDAKTKPYGDVSDRVALRKSLNCQSFRWYLDNIYPEQTLPDEKGGGNPIQGIGAPVRVKTKVIRTGLLKHSRSGLCVVSDQKVYDKKSMLKLARCDSTNSEQLWAETEKKEIKLAGILCMDTESIGGGRTFPRLMKCHESGGSQEWTWTGAEHQMLLNPGTGRCLGVSNPEIQAYVSMELCQPSDFNVHFLLKPLNGKL